MNEKNVVVVFFWGVICVFLFQGLAGEHGKPGQDGKPVSTAKLE